MALERITAPTLALSFEDDKFQTLAAARHIALSVKNGKVVAFPDGGHIWAGHEAQVFAAVAGFLKGKT
jgi:pimeloyl-ACP methyl ester carboxylesterase